MLVLVDKPTGYTSFDVVKKLKRLYPGEKIGHAGTLDPLATGLLLIAIGKDTKKIDELVWLDKTYITTIDFSQKTDTRDSDYRKEHVRYTVWEEWILIHDTLVKAPPQKLLEELLQSIIGTHLLPLTPFSAKKLKGKKLYEYAREGQPIFIDSPMELISFHTLSYEFPLYTVELKVGSGTYIRSIAHRLWEKLAVWGILISLRRVSVGKFSL